MRFPYASSAVAVVWIVMASVYPETNFFLFPAFVGLAIPLAQRISKAGTVPQTAALAMGSAGFVTAGVAALALSFAGKLDGEPLGWFGPTLLEAFVLAAMGAVIGAAIARTP